MISVDLLHPLEIQVLRLVPGKGFFNSEQIIKAVLKSKEKEKSKITTRLKDLTIEESFKQKYRDNAQKHYPTEIENFKNRL